MYVGSQPLWELPRCNLKLALYMEGKEKLRKEADYSTCGRFHKQGNLLMKLVLGGHKMSSFPTPQPNLKSL